MLAVFFLSPYILFYGNSHYIIEDLEPCQSYWLDATGCLTDDSTIVDSKITQTDVQFKQ
jgi:hypothetical protein